MCSLTPGTQAVPDGVGGGDVALHRPGSHRLIGQPGLEANQSRRLCTAGCRHRRAGPCHACNKGGGNTHGKRIHSTYNLIFALMDCINIFLFYVNVSIVKEKCFVFMNLMAFLKKKGLVVSICFCYHKQYQYQANELQFQSATAIASYGWVSEVLVVVRSFKARKCSECNTRFELMQQSGIPSA